MADQLADILNRINADPQAASPNAPATGPSWAEKLARGLTQGALYANPATAIPLKVKELIDGTFVQNERERAGQLARVPTDVIGGIIGLPNLPDTISQVVGGPAIGRVDALDSASQAIHGAGQQVGEAIAGKPLNDSLLEGTSPELGASWTRLLAGAALPLPGSWQSKLSSGLQKVSAGSKTADAIASGAAKTLEVLTPLTLNPKAAAVNIGVASAIAPALEMAVNAHDQAIQQNTAGSEQAKGALDVAGQGGKEVREASNVRTVQAGMLPSITGDDTTDAVIGASLLGIGTLAQMKFNIAGRVLQGSKKALTSYDPANPLDKTEMGFYDLLQQQLANRTQTPETAFKNVLKSQNAPNVEERVTQFKESNAMRSGASVDTRMKQWYNDGTIPDSRHSTAPLNDFFTRVYQLPEHDRGLLDYALISQRELDTRRITGTSFDLYNTTTKDLQNYVNTAKANPTVKQLFDDYLATTRVAGDYMGEQARISMGELKQFRNKNPNFVATTITDPSGNWLSRRDPKQFQGLETFEEMGSPVKLLPQYLDEVVRSTEGKKIQRDFFNEMYHAVGQNDAYAKKMIGRTLTEPPPKESVGRFVNWRNGRGEFRSTEVMDAAVRNSLQGATNPSALQIHKGFGRATKWYEGGAVGTAAAVIGNIFAPKSYLYARTFGSALRPAGVATSPLDKVMQELTARTIGKRIGIPEPFTAMPMDVFNMVNGVYGVLLQRGAVALRNSVIRDGVMAKAYDGVRPFVPIGPHTAQAAANGLATLYKQHGAAALQRDGIMGPGTFASVDPALSYKQAESVLRGHGLLGKLGESSTFVSDILHAITSAPALTTKQLNKNMPKATVNNAIRNMSGDPGASGAFRNAGTLAATVNTIPWMNIFLQSGFRLVNGAIKNPAGAVGGILTTAVAPEILGALWNANAGPEYIDYAYTQRSPEQQASSFYIAIPGRLPSEGVEIPIDPWLRPFKQIGALLATSHLGLLDGSFFSPDNDVLRKSVSDAVTHRQMSFGEDTVPRAIAKQTIMPPVPGFVGAGAALAGMQMRDWTDSRATPDKHNAGFTDAQGPKGSQFLEHYGMGFLEDLMKGIAAQAGATVYSMLDDTLTRKFGENYGRNEANQSWGESIKQGTVANAEMNLKKSGAMLGTGSLFDHALAISPSMEAAGVLVQEKLNGLRGIAEGFKNATNAGLPASTLGDKKRGFQDYAGVGPLQPQDQTMAVVGQEAQRIYQQLSTQYGGARKDLFEQRQSIANSSKYSSQAKRYMMNEVADTIIQMDRRMLVDIERHEAVISQQLGVPIKFDKVKMNQDSKQFK